MQRCHHHINTRWRHRQKRHQLSKGTGSNWPQSVSNIRKIDRALLRRYRLTNPYLPNEDPIAGLPFLARFLRQQSPTAVLTSSVRLTQLALRARTLAVNNTHIFANVHNTYSIKYETLAHPKWERRKHKIKRYYPRCDGVICVSKGVAQDFSGLSGIPEETLHTIYNPVITPEISEMMNQPVDHPWFSDNNTPIILGAGRLERAKNFPLLINAYVKLRRTMAARLIILGEGSMRAELEQLIAATEFSNDISLLGHQTNPYKFYAKASVFALSSEHEGLGNVLVEALACGAPVVATDCPSGPREILTNGTWGRLVATNDADSLAAAIQAQLTTPIIPTQSAVSRFKDETVAREYADIMGLSRCGNTQ